MSNDGYNDGKDDEVTAFEKISDAISDGTAKINKIQGKIFKKTFFRLLAITFFR